MAVKKNAATKAASPKAEPPATKSAAAPRKAAPVASETTPKAGTPKASAKAPAPKAAAKKAAPPAKLTERQKELLKAIHATKEVGYKNEKKAEQKTIDALVDKKLVKKGAKDKATGHTNYLVSKLGAKRLSSDNAL